MNPKDKADAFEDAWKRSFSLGPMLHKLGLDNSTLTRKSEVTEGEANFVFNTIDEEIIPTVPPEVLNSNPGATTWSCQIFPGHFKVWARLDQLEPELGKWLYFEASVPVKYLKFPESKSFLAFERFVALAFSLGLSLSRGDEDRQTCLTMAKGLLDPNTIWGDFGRG